MAKNKNILKLTEVLLISFVWLVLLAAPILFREDDNQFEWSSIMRPMETFIPLLFIFLINRFLLVPKLLFKKGALLYVLSVIGMIAVLTIGSYFFHLNFVQRQIPPPHEINDHRRPEALNPPHERDDFYRDPPPERKGINRPPNKMPETARPMPPYINLLIFSLLLVGFDTGLRVSFRLGETERAKAKLEKENIGSQLAFLRNQVSPHFFMNTLNNIHSLIDIDSEEAKESIIRLSKLMRHLLYESEIDSIPVKKEFDFIKNYVDLMKLRFSDKVRIKLQLPSQLPDKTIPPLLFTSYLENAFKHGISYEKPSIIDISFSIASDKLTFEIKNSNQDNIEENEHSGIGIENSRKRLDLIYGDKYLLKIENLKDEHKVSLTIPL